ncbi:hypothetical protein EV363DRAFT_1176614, partial [Boletus edulis]
PNCNRCVYLFGPRKGIKWAEYLQWVHQSSDNNPVYLVLYPHTMSNSVWWIPTDWQWKHSASEILTEQALEESGQSSDDF